MTDDIDLRQGILDTALQLAESSGSWDEVRLVDVAAALGITLDQIREHYRQKDDLVEAWFDRADSAMLQAMAGPEFQQMSSRECLQLAIMSWLSALSAHRRITREMLLYKLEFGHIHLQALGVMRVSRTVQWMREAAYQQATGVRRALEETVLTSIYLLTFAHWLRDESPEAERTRRFLEWSLRSAEGVAHRINRFFWLPPERRGGTVRSESVTPFRQPKP